MKKSDFYELEGNGIRFIQTNHIYSLNQVKHVEILSETFKKKVSEQLTNTLTAALPFHYADGNEKIVLRIKITLVEGEEYIIMNEKPLVRGSLDYYDMFTHARNLKKVLIKDCRL